MPTLDTLGADRDTESLDDYAIFDLESFERVTDTPREIAGLYFYMQLDCLIDLAYLISGDFFARPHQYTDLGSASSHTGLDLAEILARLHAQYGSHERVPSHEQRGQVFDAIFGPSDASGGPGALDFPHLSSGLLTAVAAFVERQANSGADALKSAIRDAHRPLRKYLGGVTGDSVRWSKSQALAGLAEAVSYTLLRQESVATVFGRNVPGPIWPYAEDANGDKLVEEVSTVLGPKTDSSSVITREQFSNRQRIALRGAEAVASVIDFSDNSSDEDLDRLITACYRWQSALRTTDYAATTSTPAVPSAQDGQVAAPAAATSGATAYGH